MANRSNYHRKQEDARRRRRERYSKVQKNITKPERCERAQRVLKQRQSDIATRELQLRLLEQERGDQMLDQLAELLAATLTANIRLTQPRATTSHIQHGNSSP